ncbi:MAG: ABC transporter permease [Bacteroidota bacterium]
MLKHYFLTSFRNLSRHPVYSVINVSGLSLGIASCLFIYLFIENELSYDNFHEDSERIYRILRHAAPNGDEYDIGVTSGPYAPALLQDFSHDIATTCRVYNYDDLIQSEKEERFEQITFVDTNFFNFFSFPLKYGDPSLVFEKPNTAVISEKTALFYFGEKAPIGKTLRFGTETDFTITGILDELPGNSHLQFELVFCNDIFKNEEWFNGWWNNGLYTYIKTEPNTNIANLENQFPAFMDKYLGKDFKQMGLSIGIKAEPFSQIYFNNKTKADWVKHGNIGYVYIFSAIGIFILLIACINFMNLSTARSSKRAKEVGVRKTMGAYKGQLIFQFIGEAFLLTLFAIIIAFTFVEVSLSYFNSYFQLNLPENLSSTNILLPLLALLVLVSLIAGSYPAFMLSSFQPTQVMKGEVKSGFQHVFLRRFLVVLQFSISVFLLVTTLLIGKQMSYLSEKDLGFDKDQVLTIDFNNSGIIDNKVLFAERALQLPEVISVTNASGEPGGFHDVSPIDFVGIDKSINCRTVFANYQYLETFDISLVAGRNFTQQAENNNAHLVMLNETACKKLGWKPEEVLGRKVNLFIYEYNDSITWEVTGVIEDYHFLSLKDKIEPLIIGNIKDGDQRMAAFKLKAGNHKETIAHLEKIWKEFSPEFPMNHNFLDNQLNQQYANEATQHRIFTLFASISIFIACLGIFGLASFTASLRKKEIGIRKVLGASAKRISFLLTKDFIILVGIASLVACPVGWWFIKNWLQSFAYRIDIGIWVFASAIGITLITASLTVGLQTLKAALASPVKSLKAE